MNILLLSVGSLLGQGMLDCLEQRRPNCRVIGLNSEAENPCNFWCDRVYLMPPLAEKPAFLERWLYVLERESPDLILPGRDDDVVFLAEFKQANPRYQAAIVAGPPELACMVRDKYLTACWAAEHGLPFARSLLYRPGDHAALQALISEVGFPLIAKPRQGWGSQGVCLITDAEQWGAFENEEVFLQEYLGPAPDLKAYAQACRRGLPLFFQIPETRQYAAQTLIGPDGQTGPVFCSLSTLIMGRTERFCQQQLPELEQLLLRYCAVLAQAGWQGPVNLQAKPDAKGQWKAFELNLRMSGGTSARLALGFDEMGLLLKRFYPHHPFSLLSAARSAPSADVVYARLHNQLILDSQLRHLQQHGEWASPVEAEGTKQL